jgi:hypothetical protein
LKKRCNKKIPNGSRCRVHLRDGKCYRHPNDDDAPSKEDDSFISDNDDCPEMANPDRVTHSSEDEYTDDDDIVMVSSKKKIHPDDVEAIEEAKKIVEKGVAKEDSENK